MTLADTLKTRQPLVWWLLLTVDSTWQACLTYLSPTTPRSSTTLGMSLGLSWPQCVPGHSLARDDLAPTMLLRQVERKPRLGRCPGRIRGRKRRG